MFKIKTRKIAIIAIILFSIIFIYPNKVKATKIVLDAGHGDHDTGAINKEKKIYEKDINLKIAKYIKEYLEKYKNTQIILTRSDDTFLEVYDRAMVARNNNADIIISLHMNSNESGTVNGAEVYVSNNTSLPKYKEETTKLGNKILNNLNKLGIENRGVRTRLIPKDETDIYSDGTRADYYGIIRYAMRGCKIDSGVIKPVGATPANVQAGEGVPAIIIEHCYLNNNNDYQFFDTDEDIKKLAKADADAIVEYYGLDPKEDKENKNNKYKVNKNFIFIKPDTTIDDIDLENKKIITELKDKVLTTGTKIKVNNNEYTTVKLGDTNCDGEINSADLLKIVKHLKGTVKIEIECAKYAADANLDDEINSADLLKIVKYLKGNSNIEI